MPIIQAKLQHLRQIYLIIMKLAKHEGIVDKIKITERKLGELLFCSSPQHFVGVALANEQICGLVMFNFTQNNICFNDAKGIYIENLYVTPNFRLRGIGKALLNYVARKAADNNCSRIEWWVSRENKDAQNFYKKLGANSLADWKIFKLSQSEINNLISIGSNN